MKKNKGGGMMVGRWCHSLATNVLRLCDGRIENLIINRDVSAAIAKPLLAAVLISLIFSTLENNLKYL